MTKRKSKDNDIIVSSLGNSTDNVTGSCFSISYPKDDNTRGLIILECGLKIIVLVAIHYMMILDLSQ